MWVAGRPRDHFFRGARRPGAPSQLPLDGGAVRRSRTEGVNRRDLPSAVILSEAKNPFPSSFCVTERYKDGGCGFFGLWPQNDGVGAWCFSARAPKICAPSQRLCRTEGVNRRDLPSAVILSEAKNPFPSSFCVTERYKDGGCGFFGLWPQNDGVGACCFSARAPKICAPSQRLRRTEGVAGPGLPPSGPSGRLPRE